jgi:polyisoprenoid-binding protein YceI
MTAFLRIAVVVCSLCLFGLHAAAADEWIVDAGESRIAFSGTHTGRAFTGSFRSWTAAITFDPDDLSASKAIVQVDLGSATTGDAIYDKTLPTADWLDTARSAMANFKSIAFRSVAPGRYEASGELEMRGARLPLTLVFDLRIESDTAWMSGRANLKRLDFGIGKMSDADGAWVSLDIPLEVTLVARRKP